jgi:hypothetical protein
MLFEIPIDVSADSFGSDMTSVVEVCAKFLHGRWDRISSPRRKASTSSYGD